MFIFGQLPRVIVQDRRIAQAIFENILNPIVQIVKQVPSTSRSTNGFGSIDKHPVIPFSPTNSFPFLSSPTIIPYNNEEIITATINSLKSDLNVSIEIPYNISLSINPFDNYTHRTIQVKDKHSLLYLSLQLCNTKNIPQIIERPYNISLSHNAFDNYIHPTIQANDKFTILVCPLIHSITIHIVQFKSKINIHS